MTEIEAYNVVKHYLNSSFIRFQEDFYDNTKRLSMAYSKYWNCPNNTIESCIYFNRDFMECRIYYTKLGSDICKNSAYQAELFRLLNYINSTVWPCACDGCGGDLYQPSHLYTPRIYMNEDNCYDITATTIIPYDFYEVAPLETEDFVTAALPDLMNKLSPALFGVLLGNITLEGAIEYVKTNIL